MGGSVEELLKRFHDLEVSQARLREQIQLILEEGRFCHGGVGVGRGVDKRRERRVVDIPGRFVHGPFRSILKHIGHALHIYRPLTGEIIFWNESAENLYGWRDFEALGKRVGDLLMDEESNPYVGGSLERLKSGMPWSGQLAFKKRSGEWLTTLVTKSALYEDDAFVGVITVSSDAAPLADKISEVAGDPRQRGWKRVQWRQRPQIAASVSNLASKVFLRSRVSSDNEHESSPIGTENAKQMLENIMKLKKQGLVSCIMTKHSNALYQEASENASTDQ